MSHMLVNTAVGVNGVSIEYLIIYVLFLHAQT